VQRWFDPSCEYELVERRSKLFKRRSLNTRRVSVLAAFRHTFRLMRRSPALTTVALLSIAIGTGATAVVFAAVKAVLMDPFLYSNASELVQLRTDDTRGNPHSDWVSWSDFDDVTKQGASFESWGTYRYAVFNLAGESGSLPEALYGLTVFASLFSTLGVRPMLGTNVLADEDQPNGACVMELSYGLWVRRFNSDRRLVGRSTQVNGHACRIAGVMPPEFNFPMRLATTVRTPSPYVEFWAAPGVWPNPELLRNRDDFGYGAVARLRKGVTTAAANQELARISAELARKYPVSNKSRSMRALSLVERNLGVSVANSKIGLNSGIF
jgi:putative ABC transport system permease protein